MTVVREVALASLPQKGQLIPESSVPLCSSPFSLKHFFLPCESPPQLGGHLAAVSVPPRLWVNSVLAMVLWPLFLSLCDVQSAQESYLLYKGTQSASHKPQLQAGSPAARPVLLGGGVASKLVAVAGHPEAEDTGVCLHLRVSAPDSDVSNGS